MSRGFVGHALCVSAGAVVWVLHFAVIYGVTALACARAMPGVVPWAIGLATLAAVGAAGLAVAAGTKQTDAFDRWLMAGIATLALVAIVWEAIPVLLVPVCR